jgi:predicted PurR-regulated permease PerM
LKIQNTFRLGLFGGLGVLVALAIGVAIGNLATILTYIGAALFLALGLDPFVSFLTKHGWPRWTAILAVLVGVLGAFTGLVFAIIPVIVQQISNLVVQVQQIIPAIQSGTAIADVQRNLPWLPVSSILDQLQKFVTGLDIASIGSGVLAAGISVATGVFGGIIIMILTLYFVSSLANIKRAVYQLVPASKRETFIDLAEQISAAVGRYVMGQGALGLVNGILSFLVLTFVFPLFGLPVSYSVLLAFIALLGSLIPLVGTLSASVVITLAVWAFNGTPSVWAVAVYYVVYLQVEAYVVNPRIMRQAVQVPGVVVVIAALAGGTLLGVLGALVAIPVAAAILLIIKQVFVPRQNEL